ncbi:MAG: DinB family protein [Acidobacteria bacterium]|nr:DinB family protein [Acidobacteriota bacterium]MBV9476397.1 DinB family protein [Acidobacteriota bacterium]
MTNEERALRTLLARIADWGEAHIKFDDAVKDFPVELRGKRPDGGPHSAWELLEHIRIAQWDIVEFTRDAKRHVSPEWPSGYWPSAPEPPSEGAWDESVAKVRDGMRALAEIANDLSFDLFARIEGGDGQTVLRELILAADHNSYHLGQLVMVRKILGA